MGCEKRKAHWLENRRHFGGLRGGRCKTYHENRPAAPLTVFEGSVSFSSCLGCADPQRFLLARIQPTCRQKPVTTFGGLAQLGERLAGSQKVIGSSPLSSTFTFHSRLLGRLFLAVPLFASIWGTVAQPAPQRGSYFFRFLILILILILITVVQSAMICHVTKRGTRAHRDIE